MRLWSVMAPLLLACLMGIAAVPTPNSAAVAQGQPAATASCVTISVTGQWIVMANGCSSGVEIAYCAINPTNKTSHTAEGQQSFDEPPCELDQKYSFVLRAAERRNLALVSSAGNGFAWLECVTPPEQLQLDDTNIRFDPLKRLMVGRCGNFNADGRLVSNIRPAVARNSYATGIGSPATRLSVRGDYPPPVGPMPRMSLPSLAPAPAPTSNVSHAKLVVNLGNFLPDLYPKSALRAGVGGRAVASFVVNTGGRVSNCSVSQTSGTPDLDAATCQLLVQYSIWSPATRDGVPFDEQRSLAVTWAMPND